eukprot:s1281_g12.t1
MKSTQVDEMLKQEEATNGEPPAFEGNSLRQNAGALDPYMALISEKWMLRVIRVLAFTARWLCLGKLIRSHR